MHYRDGTEAHLGDIVKGKGYNVKHEIIGEVIQLAPGTDACNLIVRCVARPNKGRSNAVSGPGELILAAPAVIEEYGATKDFELVDRA